MTTTTRPQITYQAAWTPETQEVTILRNIRSGISGPDGTYPAASREEAAKVLFARGFLVAGPWDVAAYSGGHWCDLTYMGDE